MSMYRLVIFTFSLIATFVAAFAQSTKTRQVGSFTGLKVLEGIEVYLEQGEKESIRLQVWGTEAENVRTELHDDVLKIYLNPGTYRNVKVMAYVTYKELNRVFAGSGARISADKALHTDFLFIRAGSGARITLPVAVNQVEVNVSSSADVELEGQARLLLAVITSSGNLQALNLRAEQVKVQAESAGTARVFAQKELIAEAHTAADIRYRGNPERSVIHSLTAGIIRRVD